MESGTLQLSKKGMIKLTFQSSELGINTEYYVARNE